MQKKYKSLAEMAGKKQPVPADDYQFSLAENARAAEIQALENPGLGIPVHPKVAAFMGAFTDPALTPDNDENEMEEA